MRKTVSAPDTIDLRGIVASIRRGSRWIPAGILLGVGVASIVNQAAHRYEARSTVVLQDRAAGGLSALGVSTMEGLPSSIGEALSLPGGFSGLAETEAAILQGEKILREVVGELDLQLRVTRPRGTATGKIFSDVAIKENAPRGTFVFRFRGEAYDVKGPGSFGARVRPGDSLAIPGGVVWLQQSDHLPDRFSIRVRSSWETVDQIVRRQEVSVSNVGGTLAEVAVNWTDAETAAEIANSIVQTYLQDRLTRIRNLSEKRLNTLAHVRDSLDLEVSSDADILRLFEMASGAFDPEQLGDVERIAELRASVDLMEVEIGALDNVLSSLADSEEIPQADLLAFPSFLESEAINEILIYLTTLRDERTRLLERRTPVDPDVLVLDRAIQGQEQELVELASSYRDGLQESLDQIEGRLSDYRAQLVERPSVETERLLLENRLEMSGATFVAVHTQLVRSRLEALAEGSELRQVDIAVSALRPRFPRPRLNYAIGFLAGTFSGLLTALFAGAATARVVDPKQVRARLGLSVMVPGRVAPLPKGLMLGELVVVPVQGSTSGQAALEFLKGFPELVENDRVRLSTASEVRLADSVVMALRVGEPLLEEAEELVADIESAGAKVLACVVLPQHKSV